MSRVLAVAANTFRETVRERVLYNLILFALVMTVSGLLLGQLSIRQDEKIIKDIGLAAMELFGTLIAVFIGTGLVSKEIERRSLFPLLAKPLVAGRALPREVRGPRVHAARQHLRDDGRALPHAPRHGPPGRPAPARRGPTRSSSGSLLVVALAMLFSSLTSSDARRDLHRRHRGRGPVHRHGPQPARGGPRRAAVAGAGALRGAAELRALRPEGPGHVRRPGPGRGARLGSTVYALAWIGIVLGLGLAAFRSRDFQ